MRRALRPLIAAGALAVVAIGAQVAHADTERPKTRGGHAVFTDGGPRTTIQACDDRRDGDGVVAFILEDVRRGFVELVGAIDRGGKGGCGETQQLNQVGGDLWVKVCRHDKSEHGPVQGAFDDDLEACRVENV